VAAGLGAVFALAAYLSKMLGGLSEEATGRIYYVSYACTFVGVVLFIARGCQGGS
jgi:hypothetical protein